MSISPAQMILQLGSMESPKPVGRSTQPSAPPAAMPEGSSPPENPPPTPIISPAPLSTDLRIDEEHQVYYQVVNERTGDVILEIPSEALRAISESIKFSPGGDSGIHCVDVKS